MPTVPEMVSQQLGLLSSGADPTDVRSGQSFIKPGSLAIQTGTMQDNGDLGTIVPGTTNKPIPEGYTTGGVVAGDADLVPTNIKAGTDIFGVTGTAVLATGNAVNANVLAGVTYSSAAGTGVGTMPNNGTLGTITPGTTAQTIPLGYTTGGSVAGSANLIPSNIRSGTSIYGVTGNVIQASGNATADKLLLGETASTAAGTITGTMPNNGTLGTITPGTTNKPIPLGYTSGGAVAGSGNLQAGNIRLGVNIFGVTGSLDPGTQTGGTASPEDVLTGETFTNDAGVQTGSMVNNGAVNITPSNVSQSIPIGYHNGGGTVIGDANLEAGNIKIGVTIFGIDGTLNNATINGQVEESVIYGGAISVNDPILTTTVFSGIANPESLPTGAGTGVAFSLDGIYMVITHSVSPYISIYKRTGDTYTKLPNPAALPTGNANRASFSPDSVYLAVAHQTSPFITIYKRSGDTFAKLSDPAVLPTNTSFGVAFSADGTYLTVSIFTSPYVYFYKRSGDTFTKLADPAILPTAGGRGIAFSPDGLYVAFSTTGSPYLIVYKRIGDTFTKLADPTTLPTGVGADVSSVATDYIWQLLIQTIRMSQYTSEAVMYLPN